MPRAGKGQSKGGYGRLTKAKRGTNDAKLAARRDQRAAAAAKAEARARRLAAQQAAAAATSPAPRSDHNRASPVTAPTYEPSRGELASHKRVAIIYKYELLDCPPESEWGKHGGTLRQIADHLDMPDPCDYRPIRETLLRHLGEDDVMKTRGGQGRKPILPHGQQLIAADCLQRGTGQEQAAHILTAWREGKGETALTRKPVRTAIKKLDGVRMRRGTTCTGSRDPDSAWATSRAAQSEQWRAEIETPEETAAACEPGPTMLVAHGNGTKRVKTLAKDPLSLLGQGHVIRPLGSTWPGQSKADKKLRWDCKLCGYVADFSYVNKDQEAAYIIECQGHYYPMRVDDVIKLLPPALRPADGGPSVHGRIPLEAVSWWDEKHKQLSLGSYPSKHEYRFPENASGEHQLREDGGELPARQPRVKAKYTGDGGRYGFGVMMKRNAEGELAGYKMQPFNYSDSWLCGPKKYWAREKAELARVADFTAHGWGEAGHGVSEATAELPGGRYQLRYPETWREELKHACSKTLGAKDSPTLKGYICVTDLMDHIVAESKRLFEDTKYADSFFVYHDALKQWWEPEAQAHLLKQHGIGSERQLCIRGDTNAAVAKHYLNRLVGDSPEFCPLDSNLFSDFEFAMRQNMAHTYWLPHDHPDKWLACTAKHVQRLMELTWAHDGAVRSERIVEDICRFPAALDAVIAAKGAKVEHLDNRTGRRKSKPYMPPRCAAADELLQARFERFDPTPVMADAHLPPKKRGRCA